MSGLKFAVIPVTPFQQNCTLAWCENTGQAVLIDAGGEADRLLEAVEKHGLTLTKLLLTHGHIDHVGAAGTLAERLDLPIEGPHIDDAFLLDALPQQCAMFGFPATRAFRPTRWLNHGDTVCFGEVKLDVLHCPGHTPGHVVFHDPASQQAFVGDVLFKGSIGRTDFERGNHADLIDSIRNTLWPLGDEVKFVSGHGASSTFGWERRHNPFVGDEV